MKNNCTISVKSLIVALVMISGSSAAFAQHHRPKENPFKSYENSYLTNRFFDNWYIGVGAGGQVFEGQDNSRGAFRKRITSAFEVYPGRRYAVQDVRNPPAWVLVLEQSVYLRDAGPQRPLP